MISFITGISASVVHVVSGPDHLAAVTPLAIENRTKSWKVGFFWGIGHTLGALIIGAIFLFLRDFIPIELITEYSELMVGVFLIMIGAWAIYKTRKNSHHNHNHLKKVKRPYIITATGIGLIHGLAGISHLLSILPTLALPTKVDAVIYLIGFALGTLLTMTGYAYIIGYSSHKSTYGKSPKAYRNIKLAGGLFALIIGFYWTGTAYMHLF